MPVFFLMTNLFLPQDSNALVRKVHRKAFSVPVSMTRLNVHPDSQSRVAGHRHQLNLHCVLIPQVL